MIGRWFTPITSKSKLRNSTSRICEPTWTCSPCMVSFGLRSIREISPRCKVALMTGYGTIESAVACMRAGAFDYLAKPVNTEQLLSALRMWLHR